MDHDRFQEWLSGMTWLSPAQRQQVQGVLQGETEPVASPEAIGARAAETVSVRIVARRERFPDTIAGFRAYTLKITCDGLSGVNC